MEYFIPKVELNNGRMVQALISQRNTADRGCKLSPALTFFEEKYKIVFILHQKQCYGLQQPANRKYRT